MVRELPLLLPMIEVGADHLALNLALETFFGKHSLRRRRLANSSIIRL